MRIEEAFNRLDRSKFRSSFHLNEKDCVYIERIGMDKIEEHCQAFIKQRLAPANIPNDGKQTPWRGHPVFIAQHACACCCRGCLNTWYHIPPGFELTSVQQERLVRFLMTWIQKEYEREKEANQK